MPPTWSWRLRALAVFATLWLPLAAQGGSWFKAHRCIVDISVHDLPGLLAAIDGGPLGAVLRDEEVSEAFALGREKYLANVEQWTRLVEQITALSPTAASFDARAELALRDLDWHDLHSVTLAAANELPSGLEPELATPSLENIETVLVLRPTAAGQQRVKERFDAWVEDLRRATPSGVQPADQQLVHGRPGLVLIEAEAAADTDTQQMWPASPIWLVAHDGVIAGGNGTGEQLGTFVPFQAAEPSLSLRFDLGTYIRTMTQVLGAGEADPVLDPLGLASIEMFEWRLRVVDGVVHDDLSITLKGPPSGILRALLDGMAPLPDQAMPAGGMLQLRCAFDVPTLVHAVDELLASADLLTLGEQGMLDDLRRAWTGGMAFGLGRPGPGGLVPRLFASFGTVDRKALDRLLARLHAQPWLEVKQRELAGHDCTLLTIDGFPSALQPCYALVDDTLHFAESVASLRALLQAEADGAPRQLDVGNSKRPAGDGRLLPMFELRYDNRAIHTALQDVWLPLAASEMFGNDDDPLLPLDDMPETETVAVHLHRGRGVLRRSPQRVTLSMAGTMGGPALQAVATAFGPLLSSTITQSARWQQLALRTSLMHAQMKKVHDAVTAFARREGRRPKTLGELLAAGDLADAKVLVVPGADKTEPVLHDGKQVAMTSYRYYPDGLSVEPQSEQVLALLIAIEPSDWERTMLTVGGDAMEGWGSFAESSIDEIERQAAQKDKK